MMMNETHNDTIEIWAKIVDEDGERFEKIRQLTDDEAEMYAAADDYTPEEVKELCAQTLREKYFLEGMVHAYERVLLIDFDDDGEDE